MSAKETPSLVITHAIATVTAMQETLPNSKVLKSVKSELLRKARLDLYDEVLEISKEAGELEWAATGVSFQAFLDILKLDVDKD